jgi:hypothetical protein
MQVVLDKCKSILTCSFNKSAAYNSNTDQEFTEEL